MKRVLIPIFLTIAGVWAVPRSAAALTCSDTSSDQCCGNTAGVGGTFVACQCGWQVVTNYTMPGPMNCSGDTSALKITRPNVVLNGGGFWITGSGEYTTKRRAAIDVFGTWDHDNNVATAEVAITGVVIKNIKIDGGNLFPGKWRSCMEVDAAGTIIGDTSISLKPWEAGWQPSVVMRNCGRVWDFIGPDGVTKDETYRSEVSDNADYNGDGDELDTSVMADEAIGYGIDSRANNITVQGIFMELIGDEGIHFVTGAENGKVINSQFSNVTHEAIYFLNNGSSVDTMPYLSQVIGNLVDLTPNAYEDSETKALYLKHAHHVMVQNNRFYKNGIHIMGDSHDHEFANNQYFQGARIKLSDYNCVPGNQKWECCGYAGGQFTRTETLNVVADTYIRNASTAAGKNFGGTTMEWSDASSTAQFMALLKFQRTELPAGATIVSQSANLKMTNAAANSYAGRVFATNAAGNGWVEGNGGSTGNTSGVSWTSYIANVTATQVGTLATGANGAPNITAISGGFNFDANNFVTFAVQGPSTNQTVKFDSKEAAGGAANVQLEYTVTFNAPATGLDCQYRRYPADNHFVSESLDGTFVSPRDGNDTNSLPDDDFATDYCIEINDAENTIFENVTMQNCDQDIVKAKADYHFNGNGVYVAPETYNTFIGGSFDKKTCAAYVAGTTTCQTADTSDTNAALTPSELELYNAAYVTIGASVFGGSTGCRTPGAGLSVTCMPTDDSFAYYSSDPSGTGPSRQHTLFGYAADLKTCNDPNATRRAFLKFDLSRMTTSGTVKLRLRSLSGGNNFTVYTFASMDSYDGWTEYGLDYNGNGVADPIDDDYTSSASGEQNYMTPGVPGPGPLNEGITWANQPVMSATPIGTAQQVGTTGWWELDVTSAVQNELANGDTSNLLSLVLVGSSSSISQWVSTRGSPDMWPQLLISN